jgi:hypothetical protein
MVGWSPDSTTVAVPAHLLACVILALRKGWKDRLPPTLYSGATASSAENIHITYQMQLIKMCVSNSLPPAPRAPPVEQCDVRGFISFPWHLIPSLVFSKLLTNPRASSPSFRSTFTYHLSLSSLPHKTVPQNLPVASTKSPSPGPPYLGSCSSSRWA